MLKKTGHCLLTPDCGESTCVAVPPTAGTGVWKRSGAIIRMAIRAGLEDRWLYLVNHPVQSSKVAHMAECRGQASRPRSIYPQSDYYTTAAAGISQSG